MSETTTEITELTSQYSTQVAGDLERNLKEQERIKGDIEALQDQLGALQHDQAVLVNLQQALNVPAAPAAPATEPVVTVPAPRKKASGTVKQTKDKKTSGAARKRASTKKAGTASTESSTSPSLVGLLREYLAVQSEPRSAAEIATALGQLHPDRPAKTTVVRTTLEGLVAKSQAQRSKQGRSVFYTGPEATAQAAPGDEGALQSK
ncbi:hypothetical protein [Streptomyces chartreusis]